MVWPHAGISLFPDFFFFFFKLRHTVRRRVITLFLAVKRCPKISLAFPVSNKPLHVQNSVLWIYECVSLVKLGFYVRNSDEFIHVLLSCWQVTGSLLNLKGSEFIPKPRRKENLQGFGSSVEILQEQHFLKCRTSRKYCRGGQFCTLFSNKVTLSCTALKCLVKEHFTNKSWFPNSKKSKLILKLFAKGIVKAE